MSLSSVDLGSIALFTGASLWIVWRPRSLATKAVLFTLWWAGVITYTAYAGGWMGRWQFAPTVLFLSPVLGPLTALRYHVRPADPKSPREGE